METKFKAGDRVRVAEKKKYIGNHGDRPGDGVVVKIKATQPAILVQFKGWCGGHDNSHNNDGFVSAAKDCWWLRPDELEAASAAPAQFKKGDRVRVVRLWSPNGYKVGDTGVIDEMHEREGKQLGAWVTWDKGCGPSDKDRSYLSIRAGEIELAPAPTLKPGDRVEYTGAYNHMDDHMIGIRGSVVVLEAHNNVRVKWDKEGPFCTGVFPGNLKLIEPKRELKEGDRVKVIDVGGGRQQSGTLGMLGTVVSKDSMYPDVKLDDGRCLAYRADRLELAPVEPAAPTFKVGDRVRVVRKIDSHANGWDNGWVASMDAAIGKTATIMRDFGPMGLSLKMDERNDGGAYSYPAEALELVTKSKADELVEALTAAKVKVHAAQEREARAERELDAARKELLGAEMAARAAQEAIYQAA